MAMKPVKSACVDVPAESQRQPGIERPQTKRIEVVYENRVIKQFTINQGNESCDYTIQPQQFQTHQSGKHTEKEETPPPSGNIQIPCNRQLIKQKLRRKIRDMRAAEPVTSQCVMKHAGKLAEADPKFIAIFTQQKKLCDSIQSGDNAAKLKKANCDNFNLLLTWYNSFEEITRFGNPDIKSGVYRSLNAIMVFEFLHDNADRILFFAYVNLDCLTKLDAFEKQYLLKNKSQEQEPEQHKRIIIFEKLISQRFDAMQDTLTIIRADKSKKTTALVKLKLHVLRLRYHLFITEKIVMSGEYKNSLMEVHRDKFNISYISRILEEFSTLCDRKVNNVLNNKQFDILDDLLYELCCYLIKLCRDHPDLDSDFYDIVFFIFSHQRLQALLTTEHNYKDCCGTVAHWLDKTVKSLGKTNILSVSHIITPLNNCVDCPLLKKLRTEAENFRECQREKPKSESALSTSDVVGCFKKIDKMNTDLNKKKQEIEQWLSESEKLEHANSEPPQKTKFKLSPYVPPEPASASSSEGDALPSGISKPEDTVKPAADIEADHFETLKTCISTLFTQNRSSSETLLRELDGLVTAESKDGETADDKCTGLIRLAKVEAVCLNIKVQLFEILKYISNIQQYKFAFANSGFHATYKFKERFITAVKKIPELCNNLNEIYNKLQQAVNDFKCAQAKSDEKILIDNFSLTLFGIKAVLTSLSKADGLTQEITHVSALRKEALSEQYKNKEKISSSSQPPENCAGFEPKKGLALKEIKTIEVKSTEMLRTIDKLTVSFDEFETAETISA